MRWLSFAHKTLKLKKLNEREASLTARSLKAPLVGLVISGFAIGLLSCSPLGHAQGSLQVTGTVTDENGSTVQGVNITATEPGSSTADYGPVSTDSNGTYELDINPGTYDFHFVGEGHDSIVENDITVSSNQIINAQLPPAPPATHIISGRILDADGNPAPNISVKLFDSLDATSGSATTGSDGLYSVRVPAGVYQLNYLSNSSGWSFTGTVTAAFGPDIDATNTDTIAPDVNLPQFATVAVNVKDQHNNPVPGLSVSYDLNFHQFFQGSVTVGGNVTTVNTRYQNPDTRFFYFPAHTSSDGQATFRVPVGETFTGDHTGSGGTICVFGGQLHTDACLDPNSFITVTGDTTVNLVSNELTPHTISGRILDVAGNPAPNISVALTDLTDSRNSPTATTNEDGSYSITVSAGVYQFSHLSNSSGWSFTGPITGAFGPDIDATDHDAIAPDINLPQFAKVTVDLKDQHDNPLQNVEVDYNLNFHQFFQGNLTVGGNATTVMTGYHNPDTRFFDFDTHTNGDGQAIFWVPVGETFTGDHTNSGGTICVFGQQNRTNPCLDSFITVTGDTTVTLRSLRLITAPPANLTAQSPTQAPELSWDAVDGADYYKVYANNKLIGSSATNSYIDNSPTVGTDTYYVTAVNASGESGHSNTVTVVATAISPTITSGSSLTGNIRSSLDFQVTTTGNPIAVITEAGTLPAGVTFVDNGDGTAKLAGIPAVGSAGMYTITITADNGSGTPATQSFVLTLTSNVSAPSFASASGDTETFGVPFSFTITTTGYPAPKLTKTGALPAGVTFVDNDDGTATLSGTASNSAIGVYNFTIKAKSTAGNVTQNFALTITKAPVITNIPNKTTSVGTAFTMGITAKGYAIPGLTESGNLPSGLSFVDNGNGTATLAGTPAAGSGGSYTITITATNSLGAVSDSFTLKVNEAPAITSVASTETSEGAPLSFQVTTTGFPAPSFTKTGVLPKGVTFKASNGTFSGTPKAGSAGTYHITVTAKNGSGTVTQNITIIVDPPTVS